MKKRSALLLAVLLVLLSVITACGQGTEKQDTTQPSTTPANTTQTTQTAKTEGPKDEVVTMAIISTWNTLNVYNTSGNYGNAVADQMFERLVTRTHDGKITPRLAASWKLHRITCP